MVLGIFLKITLIRDISLAWQKSANAKQIDFVTKASRQTQVGNIATTSAGRKMTTEVIEGTKQRCLHAMNR